jgi:hypothetical protein
VLFRYVSFYKRNECQTALRSACSEEGRLSSAHIAAARNLSKRALEHVLPAFGISVDEPLAEVRAAHAHKGSSTPHTHRHTHGVGSRGPPHDALTASVRDGVWRRRTCPKRSRGTFPATRRRSSASRRSSSCSTCLRTL